MMMGVIQWLMADTVGMYCGPVRHRCLICVGSLPIGLNLSYREGGDCGPSECGTTALGPANETVILQFSATHDPIRTPRV